MDCNTGWMSRLESQARAILSPLITGQSVTLTVAEQHTAAFWAAKTGLCFESARPTATRASFLTGLAQRLYREKRPGPGDKVFLAATERGPAVWQESSVERTSSASLRPDVTALFSALAVGNLLVITLFPDPGVSLGPQLHYARFSGSLPCIWPVELPVRWPPYPPVVPPDLTLAAVARRL
jgi:hypothetical protein